MGFLTNLVDQFFGRLQDGLSEEYQRQAKKAGVHPIVAESLHNMAIRDYELDERIYQRELDYYKSDLEKIKEIKKDRLSHLIKHWGSEENYVLFKQKIEEDQNKKDVEEKLKLEEYNKKVQKEKEEFLKNHNLK